MRAECNDDEADGNRNSRCPDFQPSIEQQPEHDDGKHQLGVADTCQNDGENEGENHPGEHGAGNSGGNLCYQCPEGWPQAGEGEQQPGQ